MIPPTIRTGKEDLRLQSLVVACIILVSLSFLMNTHRAAGDNGLIATAKTDIVNAFQAIQTAEQKGASNSDISPLITQLNLALQFEVNASALQAQNKTSAANTDALQSINLATSVAFQAQQLGDSAQSATASRTVSAYLFAVLISIGLAVLAVETPRLRRMFRNRRLRDARINYGGETSAQ